MVLRELPADVLACTYTAIFGRKTVVPSQTESQVSTEKKTEICGEMRRVGGGGEGGGKDGNERTLLYLRQEEENKS